jgi:maltose O-acetyltransferase
MPILLKMPDTPEIITFGKDNCSLPRTPKALKIALIFWRFYIFRIIILRFRIIQKVLPLHQNNTLVEGFRCKFGQLYCGNNVALGDTLFIDYAPIYIGDNVGFSFKNILITSTHDIKDFNKIIAKSIIIEKNVWITSNVTILAGVRIGENSIIGAGSIVTKDIPSNVFAAGNPCKPIKKIQRTTVLA